jgi:urease alpha subunit
LKRRSCLFGPTTGDRVLADTDLISKSKGFHHLWREVKFVSGNVRADGELLTCEPATVLSMAHRYFLFY